MVNADRSFTSTRLRGCRRWLAAVAIVLVASACGSSGSTDGAAGESSEPDPAEPVVVLNQGGDMEGHTPRGFAGSGTGLFAGDELNSRFPADDGVQIWLTFDLPEGVVASQAVLRSDALTVRGNPFEALGSLQAAPVRYDEFGPSVVGLEPVAAPVTCEPPDGESFTCDVSDAVVAELADGRSAVQFQLRFEETSDPDGEQDMALFFLSDSNTNEPGIFRLELS